MKESLDGLIDDKHGSSDQDDYIVVGGHDLDTTVPEGIADGCPSPTDDMRDIGNQNGCKITEIVGGIGQQGHAVGIDSADNLCGRDEKIENKGNKKPGPSRVTKISSVVMPRQTFSGVSMCGIFAFLFRSRVHFIS